jgi:hypothetical protein
VFVVGRLYSTVVRDHGVALRPDLYEHLPSLDTAASAKVAEGDLAVRLANAGDSVKGGY